MIMMTEFDVLGMKTEAMIIGNLWEPVTLLRCLPLVKYSFCEEREITPHTLSVKVIRELSSRTTCISVASLRGASKVVNACRLQFRLAEHKALEDL
jgi:hypothetical protein